MMPSNSESPGIFNRGYVNSPTLRCRRSVFLRRSWRYASVASLLRLDLGYSRNPLVFIHRLSIIRLNCFVKFFIFGFLAFSTSGCLLSYLVRSGYEQVKILSDREPIEKVLKRSDLSPEQRSRLELALDVRKFASEKLNLKASKSYTTYVDLKRPYVTYIVTVAEKFKLQSRLYWYPIVGELPYKGFFTKEAAEEEAKIFDSKKYDVMVRGVTAYSSLGWFDDPLLSTMLGSKEPHLVNLIIHESTHATLYIKSQADFNEQLATYIGNIGAEKYYSEKTGDQAAVLKSLEDDKADDYLFSEFISEELKNLKKWYETQTNITDDLRETRFKEIQTRFTATVSKKLKTDSYNSFANAKLNNAVLLYFKTYVNDLSDFEKAYVHFQKDFHAFFNFCKTLEKNPNPHLALQNLVSSNSSTDPAHR